MNQKERLIFLISYLLNEREMIMTLPKQEDELFQLYRALVNIREVSPINQEFLTVQDEMLQTISKKKELLRSLGTKKSSYGMGILRV